MKLFDYFKIWMPTKHRKSLDVSWKEGIFGNVMLTVTEYYFTPFALFLGSPHSMISLLVAVPGLFGSISHLLATHVIHRAPSRLKFLMDMTFWQGLLLMVTGLLVFIKGPLSIGLLVLFVTLFRVWGNWIGTAWGSLMSDYLEPHERGRYMGSRQAVVGIAGLLALIASGALLEVCRKHSEMFGFALLFFLTGVARLISSFLFRRMENMPYEEKPESRFTFWMFIRRFRQSNFVKFVLFSAGITFATQISGPYFSVYMLEDLKFNYFQFTSIFFVIIVASLFGSAWWGHVADRAGNARVLKITGGLIPFIPMLWCVSANWYYLLAVQVAGGFVWGGFNICSANFILDSVRPDKRVRCLSYFSLINGVALCLGSMLGGFLVGKLPPFNGHTLMTLFLVSGLLRLLLYLLPIHRFEEVRANVQKVSSRDLFFSVLGIKAFAGKDPE